MSVSCQTVINMIEQIAPKHLAEDWDNIGLQLGSPAQRINRVFLSLDLDRDVFQEALDQKADMLVVHHTPFFKPLKSLRSDLPQGRLLTEVIRSGMALYATHTNFDAAWGGVNDVLAAKLGLQEVSLLDLAWEEKLYKLAVFVPHDHLEQVSAAISKAGGGWIGNYSDCTFRVQGIGTFRPLAGTNPFIGKQGELEKVPETRLETIVQEAILSRVVNAMLKAHPYEEVAYDIYPLANKGKNAGMGRIGRLPQPLSLKEFIHLVKEKLGVTGLRYCGEEDKVIEKVAVCGGSGASYLHKAIFAGAQLLLTADIKYHEAQEALAYGLSLVDAGHFATEQPAMVALAEVLQHELAKENVPVTVSKLCTDPFRYL